MDRKNQQFRSWLCCSQQRRFYTIHPSLANSTNSNKGWKI